MAIGPGWGSKSMEMNPDTDTATALALALALATALATAGDASGEDGGGGPAPHSPASPVTAVPPVTVTFSRTALMILSASSGRSRRVCLAASRPWPTSSPW